MYTTSPESGSPYVALWEQVDSGGSESRAGGSFPEGSGESQLSWDPSVFGHRRKNVKIVGGHTGHGVVKGEESL